MLTGRFEPAGWWGAGREASFNDAIEAASSLLRLARLDFQVRAGQTEPWHPGRCAEFVVAAGGSGAGGSGAVVIGHAGELHPRVINSYKLPARACAMELDFSLIEQAAGALPPAQAPRISGYPMATQDVALVVAEETPAADVEAALIAGAAAGSAESLLEQVRLFDLYTGEQTRRGQEIARILAQVPRRRPYPDRRRGRRRQGRCRSRSGPPHRRGPPQQLAPAMLQNSGAIVRYRAR